MDLVYRYLKDAETWVTSRQIATGLTMSHRIAREHLLMLERAGVVESKFWFPANLYRLVARAV